MPNQEYVRIVSGAKTAVLMMHGICGTPNHFRQLLTLQYQVPENWSLYNLALEGHCKTAQDFGRSSMKKWKAHVSAVFNQLARTHDRVILVGHSMGTLFSIGLALAHPEKVPFIFLVAVPVRVSVKPRAVINALRIAFDRVDEQNQIQVCMRRACGLTPTKKLWKYIPWLPRMIELLQLCSQTAKEVSDLQVPCIAWQSEKDELVSTRSAKLLQNSGRVQVYNLPNSTHFYYAPGDADKIGKSFQDACRSYVEE